MRLAKGGGLVLALVLLPVSVAAQATSTIAGLVTDATGGVLPGVTVAASSPALIEQTRTVVTDGNGRYSIIDLRPGTYGVTFTLAGFSTVVREGIELTSGFAAAVNAELTVGAVEETVTVTGASPVVDVQNVRGQAVLTSDVLESVPSSIWSQQNIATMITGAVAGGTHDVGGSRGHIGGAIDFRGTSGRDSRLTADGMNFNSLTGTAGGSVRYYHPSPLGFAEVNVGLGGHGAEYETQGIQIDFIPREGGNAWSATGLLAYTNSSFQSDNFTQKVQDLGLTVPPEIDRAYEVGGGVGGAILRDKLWFYGSTYFSANDNKTTGFFNATQGTPFYTPGERAVQELYDKDFTGRVTWQAAQNQKVAFSRIDQQSCFCVIFANPAVSPESQLEYSFRVKGTQGAWTYAPTNRLLIDAGISYFDQFSPRLPNGDVGPDDISIIDGALGLLYGSRGLGSSLFQIYSKNGENSSPLAYRASMTYVTGSHTLKVGLNGRDGWFDSLLFVNGDRQWLFLNRTPVRITQHATPFNQENRIRFLGLYAQDQWSIDRMTLNLGVRFDYFKGWVPPHDSPAGRYIGERSFDLVDNVPNYKDISPRVGVAYDLSGDGKTALKVSFGRHLGSEGIGITQANDPSVTGVFSTNRTWNDSFFGPGDPRSGNFVEDCDLTNFAANGECGAIDNARFGSLVPGTEWTDDLLHGWGKRRYSWQTAVSLQQELWPGLAAEIIYSRVSHKNLNVNVNRALTAADFDFFCVTAPSDARLPGGGGNEICGLTDVKPGKFAQVDNLVQRASQLGGGIGDVTRIYDGVDIVLNGRFDTGANLSGGFSIGRIVDNDCALNEVPQARVTTRVTARTTHPLTEAYCEIAPSWSDTVQFKLNGMYPLPYDFAVSGVFQSLAGTSGSRGNPANRRYTNAEVAPSLGRDLSAGPRGTVAVPLVPDQTLFIDRVNQLDLRVTKHFNIGNTRMSTFADIFNVFNADTIIAINGTYGSRWQNATNIMSGRYARFGAQFDF